jgi:hypothetical protein
MQVKPSYRALKWSLLLVGIAASLGACVVTEGNGGDDDAFGGDSGTSTAGTKSTAGDSGTAGTKTTGGSGGSGGTAGTSAGGSPDGGSADAYVPGLCEADSPTPSVEPSCAPVAADDTAGHECAKCVKAKCCTEWQTCFGNTPTTACGFGPTADADGQFECVLNCFGDNKDNETNADDLLTSCVAGCNNQCDTADNGLPLESTDALVACANKPTTCQAECFPFN